MIEYNYQGSTDQNQQNLFCLISVSQVTFERGQELLSTNAEQPMISSIQKGPEIVPGVRVLEQPPLHWVHVLLEFGSVIF